MPSTGLWDNIAALAVIPLAVWVVTTGLGLLVERATRSRLPNVLLAPLGFCVAVALTLGLYTTHVGNSVVLPVLIVLVVAGYVLARRELPQRLNAGWALLAALAVYVVFNASVIATGHWTWSGYRLQDDTAFEMLLARHLQTYGTQLGAQPTDTATSFLQSFLSSGYPFGAQSFLAALGGLVHANVAAIYQGYLSSLAAIGALAASTICGSVFGSRLRAVVGFFAVGAALTYAYALQGSIKEIGTTMAVLCAIALIRCAILELRGYAAAIVVAVPLAAVLCTYNAAGVPYVAALAGSGLLAVLVVHRRLPSLAWIRPAAVGAVAFGVLAAAPFSTLVTFYNVATNAYTGAATGNTLPLGQLLRPLPLSEINGIWLVRDYRIWVSGSPTTTLEVIATVAMLVLAAIGFLYAFYRREPGIVVGVVAMGLVLAVVYPRAIPYAQGKLLAIASPMVVLSAACGLAAIAAWRPALPVAAVLGSALGVGILASDALAYHGAAVAPTSQMIALEQAGNAIGPRGPVLMSEFQEFAKYFMAPAQVDVGTDYPSPVNLLLRTLQGLYGQSFDLDSEQLSFVESFPYVVVRRSPAASRPPANYRLIYENYYYSVWKRAGTPRVLAHLPLQQLYSGEAPVPCRDVRAMATHAPKASRLVVSYLPRLVGYDVLHATIRSPGWTQDYEPFVPDAVTFTSPGVAGKVVYVPRTGDYRVWIQASTPRPLRVTIADTGVGAPARTISSISGINTPDEWLEGDSIHLKAGHYALDVWRPGGSLSPGDGGAAELFQGPGELGYLGLASEQKPRVVSIPLRRWRTLCGHAADWVELVS
jgi:hypothetical protein